MEENKSTVTDDQIRSALREAIFKRLKRYPGIKLKDKRIRTISKEAVREVEMKFGINLENRKRNFNET